MSNQSGETQVFWYWSTMSLAVIFLVICGLLAASLSIPTQTQSVTALCVSGLIVMIGEGSCLILLFKMRRETRRTIKAIRKMNNIAITAHHSSQSSKKNRHL